MGTLDPGSPKPCGPGRGGAWPRALTEVRRAGAGKVPAADRGPDSPAAAGPWAPERAQRPWRPRRQSIAYPEEAPPEGTRARYRADPRHARVMTRDDDRRRDRQTRKMMEPSPALWKRSRWFSDFLRARPRGRRGSGGRDLDRAPRHRGRGPRFRFSNLPPPRPGHLMVDDYYKWFRLVLRRDVRFRAQRDASDDAERFKLRVLHELEVKHSLLRSALHRFPDDALEDGGRRPKFTFHSPGADPRGPPTGWGRIRSSQTRGPPLGPLIAHPRRDSTGERYITSVGRPPEQAPAQALGLRESTTTPHLDAKITGGAKGEGVNSRRGSSQARGGKTIATSQVVTEVSDVETNTRSQKLKTPTLTSGHQ